MPTLKARSPAGNHRSTRIAFLVVVVVVEEVVAAVVAVGEHPTTLNRGELGHMDVNSDLLTMDNIS